MAQKYTHGGLAEPDLFGGSMALPAVVLRSVVETEEILPPSKADQAFKTISETADMLSLPQHVLRFWESKFAQVKPLKLRGGRRYYRPEDMEILSTIKHLLYKQGYTIEGAKKAFGTRPQPPELPAAAVKPDLRHGQLAALRQELIGLRDTLKPHVF